MLNSTVLEVAIGLVFCYASVSLITSSIYEAFASYLGLRSTTLFKGIQCLINAKDPNNQLLLGIYNHALVNPLGDGEAATTTTIEKLKDKPSYIDSKHFASALIDTVQSASGDFVKLGNDINAIENEQIRQLLRSMYDSSAGKIENLHASLATWFDAGMDRLSGSYKRKSQLWCFVIALVLAGVFNIDSLHLFKTLWQQPALVTQISNPETVPQASETLKAFEAMKQLPIGWSTRENKSNAEAVEFTAFTLVGWLVTASASLFGGPFWFDLLKLLINLRGTGTKPEKVADNPASTEKLKQTDHTDNEISGLRNSIIDLHSANNQQDESYRPVQSEERW